MKDRQTFTHSDFFVFRTPLLPFQEFLTWGEGLQAPSSLDDPARSEAAFARDCTLLRERLFAIMSRPEVWEAVFVASPDLDKFLDLWRREPLTKRGRNTERALVRYFSRMASRATPFGLFAGTSTGTIGEETHLTFGTQSSYRRHTRLDMDYLFALTDLLAGDSSLRNTLTYRPNNSLYRIAGRVRYVESRLDGKQRSYHLVAVEDTSYLRRTLARAEHGAPPPPLAENLVCEEITFADAHSYIEKLIENQILVPDLAVGVTGSEPIHPLIDELNEHAETIYAANLLSQTRAELQAIDDAGLGVEPERYRSVASLLEALPAKVELARLFQVDMFKPAPDATLGRAVLDELVRGVEMLRHIAARPRENRLNDFRKAFVARYEGREVPLVEALDEEIGIGFSANDGAEPLIKDFAFPPVAGEAEFVNPGYPFLLRKLCEAIECGAHKIEFSDSDIEALKTKDAPPLPPAFAAMATLAARSPEALARGDFRVHLEGVVGPSGARLLGRFCHGDEFLRAHVERHLRAEEAMQPRAVFAEVVHLPQGRLGNILSRPVLRDYEITYLGHSGAPLERQIPVTDLHVSVRDGRIRLRSASLAREVIPRMTSAHNFGWGNLGIYTFLGLLQRQGTTGLSWNWGALSGAPFLPRVCVGRLVLSLACWNVGKDELRLLAESKGARRFQAVQTWRAKRKLPRLIKLADADNALPIDLDNALSIESFVHLIKDREEAKLIEMFPDADNLCAYSPEGRFVHELIVPLIKVKDEDARTKRIDELGMMNGEEKAKALPLIHRSSSIIHHFTRTFPPGSEWLYIKLYTGTATADRVLRDEIKSLVAKVFESGAIDCWFFIRYSDPDFHLRLRLHGIPARLHGEVQLALNVAFAKLLNGGELQRVQLDTYEREVERYGGTEGIQLAERFFQIDSDAVLEILEMLEPGDAGADERWRLTLCGMDVLLDDFGLDINAKLALMKNVRSAFTREFHVDKELGGLSEQFRKERKSLETLLDSEQIENHPLAPGVEVFRRRTEKLKPIIAELKSLEAAGGLSVSLEELSLSYIHMHANRLLRSAHRQQELVLYDFLVRLYESRLARSKTPPRSSSH